MKESVSFPFFLLHKRATPILPRYVHLSTHLSTSTLHTAHPSTHSLNPPTHKPWSKAWRQDLSKKNHYKCCNYKTNSKVTTLIRISGGATGCRRRGRDRRSVLEVLHTRLRLHLVPKGPVLVRTQKLLLIAVGVSVFKLFLALIHPRTQPTTTD